MFNIGEKDNKTMKDYKTKKIGKYSFIYENNKEYVCMIISCLFSPITETIKILKSIIKDLFLPWCKSKNHKGTAFLEMPEHWETSRSTRIIEVDKCLKDEISYLIYHEGIRTLSCCCGHRRNAGYISVSDKDISKMKKLGYKQYRWKVRGEKRSDLFYPKHFTLLGLQNT